MAVIRRRKAQSVHLLEVPVEDRPEVISEYLRRGVERSGPKAAAKQARYYFGMNPDPSLEEIREAADHYPVFPGRSRFRLVRSGQSPGR